RVRMFTGLGASREIFAFHCCECAAWRVLWALSSRFFFSSRRRHTRSVSAFLLNRSSDLSLSKHLAHNLGNLLLLGKIGVFHNRRNASSRLLLLISKHLILCIYLVFRILA